MANYELKDLIKHEYKRCAMDYAYMFRKYGTIQHPIKGKVKFELYPFQEHTLTQLQKNRFSIILKSRQMGISTLTAAFALSQMVFKSDFKILIIATKQDVAANLLDKVKLLHQELPVWLRQKIKTFNKLSMEFENGSSIKAVSSAAHSGRSEALSLLIIDEAAFVDKIDDIWASAQMTLATGGSAVLLSTPNGVGNLFHKLWVKAESGEVPEGLEKFCPIKLPWNLHPDRDEKWRQEQDELLGPRLAAQECDCDFLTSGHTVIPTETLAMWEGRLEMIYEPVEKRGPSGDYWIWKYPDYSKSYTVVADVARGDGNDYSTFHVFEIEGREQVAEFKGKMDTTTFGRMLVSVATDYNKALLVIENTGVGWATVQVALDEGYTNLFYSYKNDPFLDENIQLRKNYDLKQKHEMVPGFTNSHKLRPVIISKIETAFQADDFIIHSVRTLSEFRTFLWVNGRPEAQRGYNDDLIVPLGVFFYIYDIALRLKQLGVELTKKAITHTKKAVYTPSNKQNDPWKIQVGKEQVKLDWLL